MASQLVPFHSKRTKRFLVLAGLVQVIPAKINAAFHVMVPSEPPELLSISITSDWVCEDDGGLVGALIVKAVVLLGVIVCQGPQPRWV